jgi:probable phosphoglycerate mutase
MRAKEPSTRIIYVRHGKTDFPLDRIYCDDKEDPNLNELGLSQAIVTAERLADMDIAAIYSSPSLRTRMTAELIAKKHGLTVIAQPEMLERRFGFWEGMYFQDIEQRFPNEYLEWKRNNAAFKPDGGESVYDLSVRIQPCLNDLINRYKGRAIIMVSHVGPIRVALAQAINVPLEQYRSLTIDYASFSIVDYGQHQNNLICLNR